VGARESRRDPVTGKIRILYMGDVLGGPSPYPIFVNDPLTTIQPVKASAFVHTPQVVRRHMRAYMPRTEGRLVGSYDLIVISDSNVQSFRPEYFSWFRNAVIDEGLGLVMIGGLETFGAVPNYPGSWGETPVAEALPVLCLPEQWERGAGRLQVDERENVLIESLPFEELGPLGVFYGCNIVGERQGISTIAYYNVLSSGERHPLLVFWEVGAGSSYAMTADWTPAGGVNFLRWAHYGDYALNVALYATGGKIPKDPQVVYEARRLMEDYRSQRQTLNSVIEFVEKFGANMGPAERILAEAQAIRKRGDESYLDGEAGEAVSLMKEALAVLIEASEKAYEIKDEALIWVYLTEWLVVASTGMICGVLLWTIMIRRRLYREVGETRILTSW
jgi:uncharacterized membrane protein